MPFATGSWFPFKPGAVVSHSIWQRDLGDFGECRSLGPSIMDKRQRTGNWSLSLIGQWQPVVSSRSFATVHAIFVVYRSSTQI